MKIVKKVFLAAMVLLMAITAVCQPKYQYQFQDPSLPIRERVNNLVSLLTLEEKVSQMGNTSPAIERLGVPGYNWWNECLHGVGRSGDKVTVFPQAIGLAATFDIPGMERMAEITSDEARAIHHEAIRNGIGEKRYKGLTFWTPNINIFRDPRWGRGQETYGEDPYLTGQLGMAMVRGLQGNHPKYLKAAACAKHYAVHSGPEPGRHTFDVSVSDYDLWDTYLPAFRDLVVGSKVASVMCAYNRFQGAPCCGNNLLMLDILREKWNFSGYVTSDCGAVDDFYKNHKTHENAAIASADAVLNGTDLDCFGRSYPSLVEAVEKGFISEEEIDVSLKRLFTTRFKLGMFDPPEIVPYAQISYDILEQDSHKEHALKMTRESMVLLKNENNILPLSHDIKKIAIIGPNADNANAQLGNYNGFPSEIITPLEALKEHFNGEVVFEKGSNYTTFLDNKQSFDGLPDSFKDADVYIFVGGISPRLEGEQGDAGNEKLEGFNQGDRSSIKLPAVQTEIMKALKATNKPVVFINMSGSAMGFVWEAANANAIIQAWYGGQAAGTAISDILFGKYNPSGRLPVTFYRSESDLPDYHDYSMDKRTYRYYDGEVLYPFGFGLSYTTFKYSELKVNSAITTGENLHVKVNITNTGNLDGEEVVQLYLSHNMEKQKSPIRSLQGVKRIFLKAGESKSVDFLLSPRNLAVVDDYGKRKVFPGSVNVQISGGQPNAVMVSENKAVEKQVRIEGEEYLVLD